MNTKDRNNIIDYILGIALIFVFSWNPNFAHGYITGLDEGVHLVWINQILLGKIPYKDIYMEWGPFLEWLPALFMKATDISLTSFRLFYHLSRLFTLVLSFFVLRQFLKTRLFVYIGVWLLVATKVSDFWSARWGSTRLLFALAAIYFIIFYIKNNKKSFLFLSGVLSGIASFNSQETGIISIFSILLFLLLFNIYLNKALKIKHLVNVVFCYLFGFAIVALPILIYFLINNALSDFIKICFVDILTVYPAQLMQTRLSLSLLKVFYLFPHSFFAIRLSYFLMSVGILLVGFIYLFLRFIFRKISIDEMKLCLVVPFGALFLLSASRQIDGEQLALCAPLVIIVLLFMLENIFLWFCSIKKIPLKITGLFSIVIIFSYFFIRSNSLGLVQGTISRYFSFKRPIADRFRYFINEPSNYIEFTARLNGSWKSLSLERANGNYVPQQQANTITNVVDFIEKNTSPDESIFVFPHEGQYYFLSKRLSATRIIPLLYAALRPGYQEEVIKDIQNVKPRYCVYVQDAQIVPRAKGDVSNELLLESIYKYIIGNYRIIRQYNKTFILERTSFLK